MERRCSGIKLLVVVGRDGHFFNVHISENGNQSNCSLFNDSALGYTLRYHKRSILNRIILNQLLFKGGSFLLADRSFPELPYLQIPFSTKEITKSRHSSSLSNYNYWHHKARFIAEKSIQRWLYRSPKCRLGVPASSSRNCILFVLSSIVLHQICGILGDEWTEDDDKIHCVIISSKDGEDVAGVDEECYRIYDTVAERSAETDYYDLKNMTITKRAGEEISELVANSTYEKLKIVAKKRRDFLVDLVYLFPNRSILFYEECFCLLTNIVMNGGRQYSEEFASTLEHPY